MSIPNQQNNNPTSQDNNNPNNTANWRSIAAASFTKRRQTPASTRATLNKLLHKSDAVLTVKLPKFAAPSRALPNTDKLSPRSLKRELKKQLIAERVELEYIAMKEQDEAIAAKTKQFQAKLDQNDENNQDKQPTQWSDSNENPNENNEMKDITMNNDTQKPVEETKEVTETKSTQPIKTNTQTTTEKSRIQQKLQNLNSTSSPNKRSSIHNHNHHNHNASNSSPVGYSIQPPNPAELYKVYRSELEKLPLELFDNEEFNGDLSGDDWLKLGRDKYHGKGVPAKSLFYENREWFWKPCTVINYNKTENLYTIEFTEPFIQKKVGRLSILFDDEDPNKFAIRLEECKALREHALSWRRYSQFVDSQPNSLFTPIQQSALHGIVGKLMLSSENLVMQRQKSVEALLIEVRDEYARAMKSAVIDFKRKDPKEQERMASLLLPPQPTIPKIPYLAVIETPPHKQSMMKNMKLLELNHFTHHPEATQVILALYKAWDTVKNSRFLLTDQNIAALSTPLTLYEYADLQDSHFDSVRDRVQNDWRALVINLIRDNLNSVYKLFVNDLEEFQTSELARFLKLVCFILRFQLSTLAAESITEFINFIQKYSNPLKQYYETMPERKENTENKENISKQQQEAEARDMLQGHLSVSSHRPHALSTGLRPLFVFKMSSSGKDIVFLPGLDTIEVTMMNLINIPTKLQSICQIDNDVVPLLAMGDVPLCNPLTTPTLFVLVENAKSKLKAIIEENIKQPLALATLYSKFGELLGIDVTKYVKDWFQSINTGFNNQINNNSTDRSSSATTAEVTKTSTNPEKKLEIEEESSSSPLSRKKADPWQAPVSSVSEEQKHTDFETERNRLQELEANQRAQKPKSRHSLKETESEINRYILAIEEINNTSPSEVTFQLIKIECLMLKEQLVNRAKEISTALLEGLANQVRLENEFLTTEHNEMIAKLRMKTF